MFEYVGPKGARSLFFRCTLSTTLVPKVLPAYFATSTATCLFLARKIVR
jgi:hypothetical protein